MGAHGHSESHDHQINDPKINDGAAQGMIILTLCLFFAMTVVGHFVFVASQNHEVDPSATEIHQEHE